MSGLGEPKPSKSMHYLGLHPTLEGQSWARAGLKALKKENHFFYVVTKNRLLTEIYLVQSQLLRTIKKIFGKYKFFCDLGSRHMILFILSKKENG